MEQPTRDMAANLRWTNSGVVWADYLLTGLDYGYRPDVDKHTARKLHTMLARALPGESMLIGVAASMSPEAVVRRMTHGVDLEVYGDWAVECVATLDTLEMYPLGKRVYWLSIPLTTPKMVDQIKAAGHAAFSTLTDFLGLPRRSISEDELVRRVQQADRIVADIPVAFEPTPVTPAQMVWLWQHSVQRGLGIDPDVPSAEATPAKKIGSALVPARLDEGAQSDRPRSGWRAKVPRVGRVLKVDQPYEFDDVPASYQLILTVADTPSGGVYFPGSEFFTLVDDVEGVDVDFVVRLHTSAGADVMKANKRALTNLNEQYGQREGENSSTGSSILDQAADALSEYTGLLEDDRNEIEVRWTAILAVSAAVEDEAVAAGRALRKVFEKETYRLVAPVGYQEELWWAMQPGVPTPRIVQEFAQITTSAHFSAYVPCIRNDLGDSSGPLLALNCSSNRIGAVHLDVAGRSVRDVSGSFAVTGELGSGKSVTMKTIAGQFVDRGGQVIGVDQSDSGEYAAWANAVTDAVIVDMVAAKYSMDPLRLFEARVAAEMAESVLLTLLRIQPTSPLGLALSAVLDPEYRLAHPYAGLGNLIDHLLGGDCSVDHARDLGMALKIYSRKTFAAALFAKDLDPLPLTAPAIIFRTNRVELPTTAQTENQHLFDNLPLEKRFGAAVYTLIAKIARGQCFADPSQPSMFLVDEADHLLRAGDGIDVVTEFVLRGRKESAFLGIGDQDCQFGSPKLRGLIKVRIAHRHTDKDLARRAIEWLGLAPDNAELLKEYMEQTSPVTGKDNYVEPYRRGEGYMRDGNGNVGRIKVLLPSTESRRIAVSTTPKKKTPVPA